MRSHLEPLHTFRDIQPALSVAVGLHSVRLTRSCARDLGPEVLLYSEPEDAVALIYQVADLPGHDLWLNGQHQRIPPVPESTMHLLDLGAHGEARLGPSFDSINVHFPRAAFKAFAEISGGTHVDSLEVRTAWATIDPFVGSLESALCLALAPPAQADRLVQEHLTFALMAHLGTTYGAMRVPSKLTPGRLAPWQVRRAKELLTADLRNQISLAELASRCELSPSHFSRAYKVTTGLTPFGWLSRYRVEVAKGMLRRAESGGLAEIGLRCGFADQSHFTRSFVHHTGETPGAWRRSHRTRPVD